MQATLIAPAQLQLPLALSDAQLVQHTDATGYRGWSTLNRRDDPSSKRLKEWRFPVERMPWVINEALKNWRHDHDLYIAQHSYTTACRSAATLLSLNVAHVDLDTYKTEWIGFSTGHVVTAVLKRCEEWNIPHPSYVVSSGRGLQLKWIWSKPLSPRAEPRWQVAHRYLAEEVFHDFGGDAKATLPTQIMRLVGSRNLKGGEVEIAWVDGGDIQNPRLHDFDIWADEVLPFTREQVREHKLRMKQYDYWRAQNNANLALLAKDQPNGRRLDSKTIEKVARDVGVSTSTLIRIDDQISGEIWQRRINVMERLFALRGMSTVPAGEGMRHESVWLAANAFGWINRKQIGPLKNDLMTWTRQHIPSYSSEQVNGAASSVLHRAKQEQGQNIGLYYMSEATFRKKLGMTDAEQAQLSALKPITAPEQRWDIGSMGFEPMRGLDYESYKAETKRRQQEAAQRTNELTRASTISHREKARQLAAEGLKQADIAKHLGVAQGTVSKWLRD